MYLGRFTYNVDQKGRLAVPARFRESLSGTVILTRGIDPCLVLYPLESWEPLAAKVDALPLADPAARAFRRLMYAEAANLELDSQATCELDVVVAHFAATQGASAGARQFYKADEKPGDGGRLRRPGAHDRAFQKSSGPPVPSPHRRLSLRPALCRKPCGFPPRRLFAPR